MVNDMKLPHPSLKKQRKAKPDKITADNLPNPECILGYPRETVRGLLGPQFARFEWWMRGQTVSTCNGERYNHEEKCYEPTGCGPHGTVIYSHDLKNWLRNEGVMGRGDS